MAQLENGRAIAGAEAMLLYVAALAIMLVLDGAWLGWIAKDFYRSQLGALMAPTVSWAPAAAFYLLYAAGLAFFVIVPALERGDGLLRVAATGAAFGLVAYGTYDLTNLATLKDFPAAVAAADMAWGGFASALACAGAVAAAARWASKAGAA
jgi:uncharacterized membrane protein